MCESALYKGGQMSHVAEFLDESRPKICLLDDNILGYPGWEDVLIELQKTGKVFQFNQGLDERLLTAEKCKVLSQSKYDNRFIFAFDNIEDKDMIIRKLKLWQSITKKETKFYVLCAFDRNNIYDEDFWIQDLLDTFGRIKILMKYGTYPYIMRFEKYKDSPYYGTYVNLASWINQPQFYRKISYREFCCKSKETSARYQYFFQIGKDKRFRKYLDMKFEDVRMAK